MITADESLGGTRVLILTTFDLDEYVHEALRAGASGFLLKDTLPNDLINAVRIVADGDALIAPKITRRLIEEFARRPQPGSTAAGSAALDQLTDREREVFQMADLKGMSATQIAATLGVQPVSVRSTLSRARRRIRIRMMEQHSHLLEGYDL